MARSTAFDCAKVYAGMPPHGSIVARPILFHPLAFNDSIKGFKNTAFALVPFTSTPGEVPDDAGAGKPYSC